MKPLMLAAALLAVCASAAHSYAEERVINEYAVEIDGTKFWLPSTIVVKKGDHVKIHAVSKVPGANSVHGFVIEGYDGVEIVADVKGKDADFTANKTGIFPFRCHLHPAHVGGQLVVLE